MFYIKEFSVKLLYLVLCNFFNFSILYVHSKELYFLLISTTLFIGTNLKVESTYYLIFFNLYEELTRDVAISILFSMIILLVSSTSMVKNFLKSSFSLNNYKIVYKKLTIFITLFAATIIYIILVGFPCSVLLLENKHYYNLNFVTESSPIFYINLFSFINKTGYLVVVFLSFCAKLKTKIYVFIIISLTLPLICVILLYTILLHFIVLRIITIKIIKLLRCNIKSSYNEEYKDQKS